MSTDDKGILESVKETLSGAAETAKEYAEAAKDAIFGKPEEGEEIEESGESVLGLPLDKTVKENLKEQELGGFGLHKSAVFSKMSTEDKGVLEQAKEKITELAETAKETIFGKEAESPKFETPHENHSNLQSSGILKPAGASIVPQMTTSPFYAHSPVMENEISEVAIQHHPSDENLPEDRTTYY